MSTHASQVVLRPMLPADVPAVIAVQEPGAAVGLAKVFPQDEFPFPRGTVARRWLEEIEADGIDCLVVEKAEEVIGFAAVRSDEFMHFGIALELWGTGAAQDAHDVVLDRMMAAGVTRAWLRVFTDNERGRRFYERSGWASTGERSHSTFPPYAELLRYERGLSRQWDDDSEGIDRRAESVTSTGSARGGLFRADPVVPRASMLVINDAFEDTGAPFHGPD